MAKVIRLSRTFQKGHPKAGEPTHFVEKALKSLSFIHNDTDVRIYQSVSPKHHTIRAGKRWKTGDMASLRVWSGKPYRSPQIAIAPDVELTVKDVQIKNMHLYIDNAYVGLLLPNQSSKIDALIVNDGLNYADFRSWFNLPCHFVGQILIWNNQNLPY